MYSALSLSGDDDDSDTIRLGRFGIDDPGFETSEDRTLLRPGFAALDERERRILELRFYDGLTQSQIAEEIGISQMHVSRLIRRALLTMRDELEATERVRS